ncbi:MAG: hypothetical protein NZ927_07205, partial [Candidatus Calescibacterium sp.]|nr:hypothetical protein [Candidatus Calescibacterium sp.]
MKVLSSVSVLILSVIFFLINLYKTFPFDENFSKIHYVGFNAHHLYYITTISENIAESLRFTKIVQSKCVFEECRKLYQHNPSAFWIALIFSLIPKNNHELAFAILNLTSAIAVFIFSVIFSFTRGKILLLLITPYISSLITRFMMTGGIVVHLIPSLLFILGWMKLKEFEEDKRNFRIFASSVLISIACFMNIMFIVPASILYFAYANQIRSKIIIPAFTFLIISPFYLIYFYQHRICVPNEWRDIIAYEFFGRQSDIGFIYSIKLIFNNSPIVPLLMILSLILIIKSVFDIRKDKDLKDAAISALILFGIFSPLVPGIISKGFFFPRFEMIPTFIMLHTIYIRFNKTKVFSPIVIAFSIFSGIQTFQIQNKVFTFKDF